MAEKTSSLKLGPAGEALAKTFLESHGYKILASNYRCPLGEIDFICEENATLVFVEVKARRHVAQGRPEEAVHVRKQRQLVRVAEWYLSEINYKGKQPVRFDVVSVLLASSDAEPKIELFRDAFSL